jgi:hypothetical protein
MTNFIQTHEPRKCSCCGQTETWEAKMTKGAEDIVKAIAGAIKAKGINIIHPAKEMIPSKLLTVSQNGNLSVPRNHGLIAQVEGEAGNYCLTKKAAEFLKGKPIPRIAIVSKVENRQIGYLMPDETDPKNWYVVNQDDNEGYWGGFEINEGRVVKENPNQAALKI